MSEFDLVVVGSGPAGQKAAIQAAKLGRNVALVERHVSLGGACVNTGTIPSKTIREAILYLTGLNQRAIYGQSYRLKDAVSIEDLALRTRHVVEREREIIRDQLLRNQVTLLDGCARFLDPHTIAVDGRDGSGRQLTAKFVVVATGSTPAHPSEIEFNSSSVLDSDDIVLRLAQLPATIVIVGAGVIGIEFASMFAALGSRVTIVDARDTMLDFCDPEITEALRYQLRELNVVFRFGERVEKVEARESGTVTMLASGKVIPAEVVFYSAGRVGAVVDLDLGQAGLAADDRGRISVDENYRTAVPHIYAVGDVVGFPSLASTSAEQGRLAACHIFGVPSHGGNAPIPIGIYSIPEISYVGRTEPELTEAMIPYEVGISHYRELARGQILGDSHGLVKLLVSPSDRTLLGVHAFGAGATEVVHIGQAVMGLGGTIDYLVESVFNYPTFAEAYKVAALDALNKLRAVSVA
ncbi:MAG TPA: Si-specific NAD(P)(+) transhydrogenase [Gaiellaceae bacterium]|jgi:NAD(P) transhydrogenase|nr:Si-specific NAD(P)(+) transhydrogenase [Gaiellaceae bacterium]